MDSVKVGDRFKLLRGQGFAGKEGDVFVVLKVGKYEKSWEWHADTQTRNERTGETMPWCLPDKLLFTRLDSPSTPVVGPEVGREYIYRPEGRRMRCDGPDWFSDGTVKVSTSGADWREFFDDVPQPSPLKVGDICKDPARLAVGVRFTSQMWSDEKITGRWAHCAGWKVCGGLGILCDEDVRDHGVTILPGEPEATAAQQHADSHALESKPPAPSPKSEPGHSFADPYCLSFDARDPGARRERACIHCGESYVHRMNSCIPDPQWRANRDAVIALCTQPLVDQTPKPPLTGPPAPNPHGYGALAGRYRYERTTK